MRFKGIDVSSHQGKIDWIKVKPNIDFAVLRCGYGGDIKSQDDSRFSYNVSECERLGIPFAVYLYSYATTNARIDSEVSHTKRLLKCHKPFCVYIDMEDRTTVKLGKVVLTSFAKRYCEAMKSAGYKVGVYANQNWFQNYLDVKALYNAGYSIWCAKYSSNEPDIAAPYDIWQYSSSGKMAGITSGGLDMNYMYKDIRNVKVEKPSAKKSVTTIAKEVLAGKWGNGEERKKKLKEAGYNYDKVQDKVNELLEEAAEKAKKAYSGYFPVLPSKGYLEKGDEGIQVRRLQSYLEWYGFDIEVDGDFGPDTENIVKAFQKAVGIDDDGKFGPVSLKKAKSIKK